MNTPNETHTEIVAESAGPAAAIPPRVKKPRCVKTLVPLASQRIEVYAGVRVATALEALSELDIYRGAKIIDLIEAVYEQGKKDGARNVFDRLEVVREEIPHRNPGKPKKRKGRR
jgi:hypothetical protein